MKTGKRGRWSVVGAVCWVFVFLVQVALGATGWLINLYGDYEPDDFGGLVMYSIVAGFLFALPLLLAIAGARQSGVGWHWVILRSGGVCVLGLAVGSLVRLTWFETSEWADAADIATATRYSWWVLWFASAVVLLEPLAALLHRIAVAVWDAPRPAAEGSRAAARRWPGPWPVRWAAGTLAVVLLAGSAAVLVARGSWHILESTDQTLAPTAAAGTIDGREVIAVPYQLQQLYALRAESRIALYELATGGLVWDELIERESTPATQEAIAVDDTGVYVREDGPGTAEESSTWRVLDPGTGAEVTRAVPEQVEERARWLDDQVHDDGIDYRAENGDIVRSWRFSKSRVVNPLTARPVGENGGFALDGYCCANGHYSELTTLEGPESDATTKAVIATYPRMLQTPDVIAETASGLAALISWNQENKWVLVIAGRDGFTSAEIGDRGWLRWR